LPAAIATICLTFDKLCEDMFFWQNAILNSGRNNLKRKLQNSPSQQSRAKFRAISCTPLKF
jgi:hypothetical protein